MSQKTICIPYLTEDKTKSIFEPYNISNYETMMTDDLKDKNGFYYYYSLGNGHMMYVRNNNNILEYLVLDIRTEENINSRIAAFIYMYDKLQKTNFRYI